MTQFSIITAISDNGVIGTTDGKLCWHSNADMQRFRELTLHQTVLMGRKTYESCGSLPDRKNLVLSRSLPSLPDAQVIHQPEEVFNSSEVNIWVIGGSEIYKLFLPYTDFLYVTRIHQSYFGDDTVSFPNFLTFTQEFVELSDIPVKEGELELNFQTWKHCNV